ncbi:fluoride efflux transporter FluC [Luteimicrobium subarcticum]|uniref:Fluoride-specific ion channel FluC n=1 Tax=Luteimicrobium subarcticum TaxID=620910 RepID=A0A2M8W1L4_9MICO|nr:CrcB family protein [Luteimicrobium subarcticum]PJI84814.1 CrcB protein [Luteimicrobium subarcticum]
MSTTRSALLVGAGGAVGTLLRASLGEIAPDRAGSWPWTTFTINVVGAFVLGLLLQALLRRGPDTGARRTVRLLCGTGVLGGFTTYSTFLVQDVDLLRDGSAALGLAYLAVSVVLGLVAAGAGAALANRLPVAPAADSGTDGGTDG